jgi:acetyltransferase-like isoleucine patch superfamily enzyme
MTTKQLFYNTLRKIIFPIRNLSEGANCHFRGRPRIYIHPQARVVIGESVLLNSNPKKYHAGMPFPVTLIADRPESLIQIGDKSRLHGCCIHAWSNVQIGRECLFAAGSQVLDSHGHISDMHYAHFRTTLQDVPSPIVIEDYCWLGLGALVLKGVHLGKGCIVAAHSVLTEGKYPPYSLIVGNPGKVVRTMNPSEIVQENINPITGN